MSIHPHQNSSTNSEFLDTGWSEKGILERTSDPDFGKQDAELQLKEFTKQKIAKKQNLGFQLLAIGSVLGFLSCVMTMLDLTPGWNGFFLYGLTSAAILVIFYGLYLVFE